MPMPRCRCRVFQMAVNISISFNNLGTLNFVDHVNNEFAAFYQILVFMKLTFNNK